MGGAPTEVDRPTPVEVGESGGMDNPFFLNFRRSMLSELWDSKNNINNRLKLNNPVNRYHPDSKALDSVTIFEILLVRVSRASRESVRVVILEGIFFLDASSASRT